MSFLSAIFGKIRPVDQVAPWAPVDPARCSQDGALWRLSHPGGSVQTIAPTGSMRPYFDAGDFVLVVPPCAIEQIQLGTIVIMDRKDLGLQVIHRIVEIDVKNQAVITKGDNNSASDGWHDYALVLGICAGVLYSNTPSPVKP